MDGGYIKIFRKMTDWEWYQDANTLRLFIHCLMMANYEDKKWRGRIIEAGSFVTSLQNLADDLKLTVSQIRTAKNRMIDSGEIAQEIADRFTVITVRNWALYQGLENDEIADQIATESHDPSHPNRIEIATTEEIKNVKEKLVSKDTIKKKKSSSSKYGTIEDVFGEYCMGDDELLQALLGFRDYRLKRSPLTPYAAHLICLELDKLAKTTQEKIEIVKQSIRRGWTDVFALKDFGLNGKGNASNKSFDETIDERLKNAEAYMRGETS
jgi:hypothetical protein